ncbi:hypothetical protein UB46_41060 [Burkholderiaceae bacterium 16]|nr:hypothetical protein UB46_41060 [Burkholderiaceae bacterium 16]
MSTIPASIRRLTLAAAAAFAYLGSPAFAADAPPAAPDESAFLSENDAAMTKMMDDMAIKPSGDIARDFVAMMAPHHQGAIDMAQAYLRYGQNEQLRRVAQEIIVEQQQEIIAMRIAVGLPLPPSAPAATQQQTAPSPGAAHAEHATHHSMSMTSPANH